MAELKIKADSGGGTVALKGPATTTSNAAVQLTLPVDDGTSGQYLKTDGSGALSWATVSTGVDGISSSADATAITIDSSERVMIGTTTPGYSAGDDLTIQPPSGSGGITIRTGTSDSGKIYFADGTSGGDQYKGTITYSHANDTLAFASPNGDALTVETNRDVTVEAGNLVIGTSGKGIDFSATADGGSGNTNNELLADYEEGAFTPTISVPTGTGTLASNCCTRYQKVGNAVHIWGYFGISWSEDAAGIVTIGNLPYATPNLTAGVGGGTLMAQGSHNATTDFMKFCYVNFNQNASTFKLYTQIDINSIDYLEVVDCNYEANDATLCYVSLGYLTMPGGLWY